MAGRYKSYHPIRRRSRHIPWGYRVSKHDPKLLEPIPEMLRLLDQAERAWRAGTASQQQIADWLTAKTGVPITRTGLRVRFEVFGPKMRKRAIRPDSEERLPL